MASIWNMKRASFGGQTVGVGGYLNRMYHMSTAAEHRWTSLDWVTCRTKRSRISLPAWFWSHYAKSYTINACFDHSFCSTR